MRLALALVMLCGCVRSHVTECGDFVCPEASACVTYTPLGTQFCIDAADTRCAGAADGTLCDAQHGTCYGGGCFPVGCGNGVVDDPSFGRVEQCDDGNRLSHDGCSSACTLEQAAWDVIAPGPPPPLSGASLAYDAAHEQLVLFGGRGRADDGGYSAQTWVRTAARSWELRRSGPFAPEARWIASIAYDAKRGEVVMFGGANDGANLRDTWVWDGQRWQPRTPAHAPAGRGQAAMAFDAAHGVVVMYGGHTGKTDAFAETWLWDGADWTLVTAGGPAAGMAGPAMAFDPVRGEIVMIGVSAGTVQTWRFDGERWAEAAGPQPPSAADVALAWDPTDEVLVLSGPGPQQWTWNGTAWSGAAASPLPDGAAAAASATVRDGVVTFGGHPVGGNNTSGVDSVWKLAHGAWTAEVPRPRPAVLTAMGVAYDTDRQRVEMFGGTDSQATQRDELWELGPAGWTRRAAQMAPADQPATTSQERLAYDAVHHTLVRVGSMDPLTWTWDGARWSQSGTLADVQLPSGIEGFALAFDPSIGVMLVGGDTGAAMDPTERFVVWDGTRWTDPMIFTRPYPRRGGAMAYDPIAKKTILFGGASPNVTNETWEWDGAARTWTLLQPTGIPTAREDAALVWNPARQRLVLFGGGPLATDTWEWDRAHETWVPFAAAGGAPPPDVRSAVTAGDGSGVIVPFPTSALVPELARLRWTGAGSLEACTADDADRDGLAGCDDPDCAAACSSAEP